MSLLLRVLAAGAVVAAAVALAVWLAWAPLVQAARARIEPALAKALHMSVRVGTAHLTIRPLRLTLGDVALGEEGAALRIRDGHLTVALAESLRRGEPVADLEANDVEVAPLGFAAVMSEPDATPRALPRFSLRRVRIANVRVVIPAPDAPLVITAAEVKGRVRAHVGNRLQVLGRTGDLRLTRGDGSLETEGVRAKLEVAGRDVIIRSATVDGEDVALRVAYDPAHTLHQVRIEANVAALDLIDPALREISGHVVLDGTVSGRWDSPQAAAEVRTQQLLVADQALVDLAAQLRFSEKTLELVSGRFQHTTGAYVASGRLVIDDRLPFAVKAEWQYAPPPGDATKLSGAAALSADGTLTPLRLKAEATGKAARSPNGEEAVDVSANAQLADGALQAAATLTQKSGNRVDATLSIASAGSLDGVIRARVSDAPSWQNLLGTPVTPEVKGVLTADVLLSGTREHPQLTGEIRGRDLNVFGASISRVEADVRSDTQQLQLQRLDVRLTRGSITGNGTFGLQAKAGNDWRVVVADIPTQTVAAVAAAAGVDLPLWGGQVAMQASGGGPWQAVKLRAGLQVDNFYLQREPVDRVLLNVESAWPQWTANGRVELGPEEHLTLTASGTRADTLTVAVESTRWDLARVQTTSRLGLRGQLQVRASAHGAPSALNGNLDLTGAAVEWSGRAIGNVTVAANGQQGRWTLSGQVGDLLTATGSLETRGELPLRGTIEWNDADLAPLVQPDQNVRILSSGALRVDGPLSAVERINGSLQVNRLDILAAEPSAPLLSVQSPILMVARGGRLDLGSFQLSGTGTELTANGWLAVTGECDVAVDATSNLALVEALSPTVHAARGNMTVTGRARRRAGGNLELTGSATLERVAVDLGPPWVAVNVNGRMSFHETTLAVDTLTGRLAGGTFEIGGRLDLATGPDLTWTATEIAPSAIPDVEAEVSGSGSVRGRTWSDITVAGEVEILRALYDRRFALTDLIPLFQRRLAKPRSKEPSPTVIHLDLRIVAPDEIFVDNNVAKIEMRTELALSGTVDALVITGPIEVLNGEVKFRGRTFTIETGLMEFRPELGRQAYLNITARTVVPTAQATYAIDTHIVGTTEKYQITFTSDDPGLSQTDLVSLVTFGKTAADLQQGGGGVSVNDLIALAPGLYQEQAQERAQSLLGIDRVELEPGYSKSTGLYEPRISLGKDLTQDLTASLSSTFGTQRRQEVQLEYRVSPRLSLLGDWESSTTKQAGAFGAEIKFRYPFRTFPGWTALLPWPGEDVQ